MTGGYELGARGGCTTTLFYGCAHYGKSLFWYASEFLFAFFLTEVGAISADRMGLVLAAGLFVSAAIDIGVGSRLSRLLPNAASAGKLQLAGAAASAASMLLMFACYWLPDHLRLAAVLAMSLMFRIAYALYDIPQNSLLSLATHSERARTNVASMRYVFSGLAALTVAACLTPLLQAGGLTDRAVRFCLLALAFSVVAVASALLLARALRNARAARPQDRHAGPAASLRGEVRWLIALMFFVSMAGPTFSKVEPYFAAFVLRDPLMGGGLIMAVSVGMTITQPLWGLLAQRTPRPALIALTAGAVALAAFAFLFASQAGGLVVLTAACVFGAACGGLGLAIWAAFGDAVARHAQGREGWAYGLFTASAKISLGVSGLGIGLLLAQIDYRGADSDLLVGVMLIPSVVAGMICAVVGVWRGLHDARFRRAAIQVSGKTSP